MKRIMLCIAILLLFSVGLYATNLKIAYVNVDSVYNQFSEKAEAEQQFNQEVEAWQSQLADKEKEINNLKEEYSNLPPIVTEERKAEKQALIEKRQREYYELADNIRNSAAQRQVELLKPISKKIVAIIEAVAEENDFDLVLNSQQGEVVLYGKKGLDITDQVIEKLNETTEKPENKENK